MEALGRHMGHWENIKNIRRKLRAFGRHMGYRADIVDSDQTYGTLGKNWEAWADIGVLHISQLE